MLLFFMANVPIGIHFDALVVVVQLVQVGLKWLLQPSAVYFVVGDELQKYKLYYSLMIKCNIIMQDYFVLCSVVFIHNVLLLCI